MKLLLVALGLVVLYLVACQIWPYKARHHPSRGVRWVNNHARSMTNPGGRQASEPFEACRPVPELPHNEVAPVSRTTTVLTSAALAAWGVHSTVLASPGYATPAAMI